MSSKLEARASELDRQLAGIRKLIMAGMKMLNENQGQIKVLTTSQQETDRILKYACHDCMQCIAML